MPSGEPIIKISRTPMAW